MKLLCAMALAVFSVAAPMASPAPSLDLSLMSALCSDDYYEDTAGQCGDISADGEIFIFTKYGVVITGETDEDVIVLYLDDQEDTPVGSIQPRNEDAVLTDDESANEQLDTMASRIIIVDLPSETGGEAADDITTTGPSAQSIPAAEPVDDRRNATPGQFTFD